MSGVCAGAVPARGLLAAWLSLVACGVSAQSSNEYQLGQGFLGSAALELSAIQRDNYFFESADAQSASGYEIKPSVAVSRSGGRVNFALDANLAQADFDLPGELDNYLDYAINSRFVVLPAIRHRFDLSGGYQRGHDSAGLRRTENVPDFSVGEIDQWNQTNLLLNYRYGSPGSVGSNSLRAGQSQRRYETNRSGTVFLDYIARVLEYELAYAYSPKTAVLFVASQRAVDYRRAVVAGGNRNGNELSVRTGLRWEPSAKTSGELQLGVRDYSVDGRERPSRQGLSYRARLNWQPREITTFTLDAGQSSLETFRADTLFIDEGNIDLGWRQQWSSRFSTRAGLSYSQSEFVGIDRTDDFTSYSLRADYRLLSQAGLFAIYQSRNRDSTFQGFDYDAPEARLGVRLTL